MTKHEAAVISAFTGIMIGKFSDMHEYAERIMGRSIWSHEFGNKEFAADLKSKAETDFMLICRNIGD